MRIKLLLLWSPLLLIGLMLLNTCLCCLPTCWVRPPLRFSPNRLPKARVGEVYRVEIQITNAQTPVGNFWIPPEDLPEGLTFTWEDDMPTGILEGIPEEAGTFTLTVSAVSRATNINGQTGSITYTLEIED